MVGNVLKKGLKISGYESDFLINLVSFYLFKKFKNQFNVQSAVTKILGNKCLQFTCELLRPNICSLRTNLDNVLEITTYTFPDHDLEMFWNEEKKLEFQVLWKVN